MGLDLQIIFLTVPEGTEFPGTFQELGDELVRYMEINGEENFSGINFGDVEPSPENRDRPWFKTDIAGNPIGWFSWNGSAWTPTPVAAQSGGTGDRPGSPETGQLFFDSDIEVMLMWNGSIWTTVSGSPGDVKEVKAATLAAALLKNPGWSDDSDSAGMVIVGVTTGTGFEYNDTGGEVTHALTEDENGPHVHDAVRGNFLQADGNAANPSGIVSGVQLTGETGSSGLGTPHNNMMPYRCYWRIVKD